MSMLSFFQANVTALFVGDSTLLDKVNALHSHGVSKARVRFVWSSYTDAKAQACNARVLKRALVTLLPDARQVDLVVFNVGLHPLLANVLNDTSAKPHVAPRVPLSFYEDSLHGCGAVIQQLLPRALHLYKLTNAVCPQTWIGSLAEHVAHWRTLPPTTPGYGMQLSEVGVASLHQAERRFVAASGWLLLDSYTAGRCACTRHTDGRHYPALVPHFLVQLHLVLASQLTAWRTEKQPSHSGATPRSKGKSSQPLVLVAGLGGSCSEAAVSIFDAARFHHPGARRTAGDDQIAGCGAGCPLRTQQVQSLVSLQRTLNYQIDDLAAGRSASAKIGSLWLEHGHEAQGSEQGQSRAELIDEVTRALARLLDSHKCHLRACVFKEEHLLFLLPVFRRLASRRRQQLCVVLPTRAANEFVLGHNWIGFGRWYGPLFGEASGMLRHIYQGSEWRNATDGDPSVDHRFTYDPSWIRMKAALWARVAQQTWQWLESTAADPNVHNVLWRCKVDSRTQLALDLPRACGGGSWQHDLAAGVTLGGDVPWRQLNRTKGRAKLPESARDRAESIIRNLTAGVPAFFAAKQRQPYDLLRDVNAHTRPQIDRRA